MRQIRGIYVGTAAWSIPKVVRDHFAEADCLLSRYSSVFNAVEINSSFYRDHKAATYERWRAEVAEDFRFSVKLAKAITHERRLKVDAGLMQAKLEPILHLQEKLGCLLVQLPPSLEFQADIAAKFFTLLRKQCSGLVVLEPRHASWFTEAPLAVLSDYLVSMVTPDPRPAPGLCAPAGSSDIYYRLHGSPEIYVSPYSTAQLEAYAQSLQVANSAHGFAWCIFDNTKFGQATTDALELRRILADSPPRALVCANAEFPRTDIAPELAHHRNQAMPRSPR